MTTEQQDWLDDEQRRKDEERGRAVQPVSSGLADERTKAMAATPSNPEVELIRVAARRLRTAYEALRLEGFLHEDATSLASTVCFELFHYTNVAAAAELNR